MADNLRWRYSDTKPVVKPVSASAVIEIGDLVGLDAAGNVAPASAGEWNTDLETTQREFRSRFLGVAMQRSREGDTSPIRVATEGVFEFDCRAVTFELGAFVGPAKHAAGFLENQRVTVVDNEDQAVGRSARRNNSDTRVYVDLLRPRPREEAPAPSEV